MKDLAVIMDDVKAIIYSRIDECATDAVFAHFIRLFPDGSGLVSVFGEIEECCHVIRTAGYEVTGCESRGQSAHIVWFTWDAKAEWEAVENG